ncbi:MAG TPA: hypothetical protein VMA77_13190 [Solirubrobacteraceae bacterium]|nr:hypothetical protein [Solirubrobacteraceae bacterium]
MPQAPTPGAQPTPQPGAQPAVPLAPVPSPGVDPARRQVRADAIAALQRARGSDALICYITSTRPNLQALMMQDQIRFFYDHLPTERVDKLDLLIHSDGGDSVVPWRLMTLLRERANEITVLVPYRAFSAATATALGADNIIMHPMGTLGPIDPSVNTPFNPLDKQTGQRLPVSVEDVAAYTALVKEDVGIRHEDELVQAFTLLVDAVSPLTLGSAKRITAQARMLGEKLVELRNKPPDQHEIDVLLGRLTTELYFHGHPIGREEARGLELPVAKTVPADVENAMWDLYLAYEEDMLLTDAWDAIAEALSKGVVPLPPIQSGQQFALQWVPRPGLIPATRVVIESATRADVLEQDLRVEIARMPNGTVSGSTTATRTEWVRLPKP